MRHLTGPPTAVAMKSLEIISIAGLGMLGTTA